MILGSGIGGMTTAAIMAKSGKKVLVLEQHDQAGGACHTFKEKGKEFNIKFPVFLCVTESNFKFLKVMNSMWEFTISEISVTWAWAKFSSTTFQQVKKTLFPWDLISEKKKDFPFETKMKKDNFLAFFRPNRVGADGKSVRRRAHRRRSRLSGYPEWPDLVIFSHNIW